MTDHPNKETQCFSFKKHALIFVHLSLLLLITLALFSRNSSLNVGYLISFKYSKSIFSVDSPSITTEECPFTSVRSIATQNRISSHQNFILHLMVHGSRSLKKTLRFLSFLSTQDYKGDVVKLSVIGNFAKSVNTSGFVWNHGPWRFIKSRSKARNDFLKFWLPDKPNEFAFLVSSSTHLSNDFYAVLRNLFASISLPGDAQSDETASSWDVGSNFLSGISFDPLSNYENLDFVKGTTDVFLAPVLGETCQLVFPYPWKMFSERRRVKNASDLVPDAFDFSSTCQTDLSNGFSTFLSEREMLNLHVLDFIPFCRGRPPSLISRKIIDARTISTDSQNFDVKSALLIKHRHFPRYDSRLKRIKMGIVARDVEELQLLLETISSSDHSVIGLMISPMFEEMLLNWLCYIKELNIHNFFLITQSESQSKALALRGLHSYVLRENVCNLTQQTHSYDYGSFEYKCSMSARTHFIGRVLHMGFKILLSDVDTTWLSNPFPFMKEKGIDFFAQTEPGGNPCGGFLYLLPTRKTIQLWDDVDRKFEEHMLFLSQHPSRSNRTRFEELLSSNKHVHEQNFLNDALFGGGNSFDVKWKPLDRLLFIDGLDYFVNKLSIKAEITPVMIHNNFLSNEELKIERFRKHGLWRLDDSGNCECLQIKT